jgi:nicotinate-nucleotide adenylyltransferase
LTDSRTAGTDLNLVAIFGGTFDPVHDGHLGVLRDVSGNFPFDRTHVVLSARPPHRNQPVASISHRAQMAKLAFGDEPGVFLDDEEVNRRGRSYTVWTLRAMRHRFPDASLVLVIGADALRGIMAWYRGWEILSLCHLLVYPRPGYMMNVPDHARLCTNREAEPFASSRAGTIRLLDSEEHDISASEIRAQLASDEREHILTTLPLPAGVAEYIDRHDLYMND